MRKKAWVIGGFFGLVLAGLVIFFEGGHRATSGGPDSLESGETPLGGLFDRAARVSRLKEQMGQLREVWPAMDQFAQAHQGVLPTNLIALKPYLPTNLAKLSDEDWEMPSGGMVARPLMARNDVVLLQQKNVPPDHPKIIVYGDGHIEYKR
jgi:hypothetical protein